MSALAGKQHAYRTDIITTVVIGIIVSSCTPTVYKPQVETFGADVATASTSFDQLVTKNVDQDFNDRNIELTAAGNRLSLSRSCSDIEWYSQDQNTCLTAWSRFRQDQSGRKPTCAEPENFSPLVPPEMTDCQLGFMRDGNFVPSPTATSADAGNHRRLVDALAAYAAQLGAIVSAEDTEKLDSATADAGIALNSLLGRLMASDTTEAPSDVGPIVALVGGSLRVGLEARRFQHLKRIVLKADPIVEKASGRLSVFANQLYLINVVEPAFKVTESAALRAVPNPRETFATRVEEAALRHREYNSVLSVAPGDVFRAVAEAHRELVGALNDPARQYDALRIAIASLTEKAKALAAVLGKGERHPLEQINY